jgi:hypothetical protein
MHPRTSNGFRPQHMPAHAQYFHVRSTVALLCSVTRYCVRMPSSIGGTFHKRGRSTAQATCSHQRHTVHLRVLGATTCCRRRPPPPTHTTTAGSNQGLASQIRNSKPGRMCCFASHMVQALCMPCVALHAMCYGRESHLDQGRAMQSIWTNCCDDDITGLCKRFQRSGILEICQLDGHLFNCRIPFGKFRACSCQFFLVSSSHCPLERALQDARQPNALSDPMTRSV